MKRKLWFSVLVWGVVACVSLGGAVFADRGPSA